MFQNSSSTNYLQSKNDIDCSFFDVENCPSLFCVISKKGNCLSKDEIPEEDSEEEDDDDDGPKKGTIIGIVIGCTVFLVLVGVFIFKRLQRRRRRRRILTQQLFEDLVFI